MELNDCLVGQSVPEMAQDIPYEMNVTNETPFSRTRMFL